MKIGLVGKPNAGKSTFFTAATSAEAQIGEGKVRDPGNAEGGGDAQQAGPRPYEIAGQKRDHRSGGAEEALALDGKEDQDSG